MRKVGIMSMQRIANYGSFLQAYALKQLIEEVGCNVEFERFAKATGTGQSDDNEN